MSTHLRDGAAIYEQSFAIIRSEADLSRFSESEAEVAVRMIHACGAPEIARDIVFSRRAAEAAREEAAGFAREAVAAASRKRLPLNLDFAPPTTTPSSSQCRARISARRASPRRNSNSAPRSPSRPAIGRRASNCRWRLSPRSTMPREAELRRAPSFREGG